MSSNNAESKLVMKCPGCRAGQLVISEQKALLGLAATEKLTCDKCGAAFIRAKDKFRLVEVIDKTSQFWRDYKECKLTIEQWEAIAGGAPVHYDTKAGSYVPYVPDDYSEPKPSYCPPPPTYEPPPTHTPLIDENPTMVDSINTSESYHEESDELGSETVEPSDSVQLETKESPKESQPSSYGLTVAGKYLLSMTFNDLLETCHLLRCVEKKTELDPEQLKILLEAGLLRRKRRKS